MKSLAETLPDGSNEYRKVHTDDEATARSIFNRTFIRHVGMTKKLFKKARVDWIKVTPSD